LGQAPGGQAFASPGGTIDGDNHGEYKLAGRGGATGKVSVNLPITVRNRR
jgi:hypothetical protein